MKIRTVLSIGLLICFFVPWLDFEIFTVGGYEIPFSVDKIISFYDLTHSGNAYVLKISYTLFLIPICSIINIIKDLSKNEGAYFLDEFAFGLVWIICIFIYVSSLDGNATSVLTIGYYLTGIFSVVGLFSFAFEKKRVSAQLNIGTQNEELPDSNTTNSFIDKSNLLDQLSKLADLKEKNVIPEDIYEQERQNILSKFKNGEPAGV